MMNPNKIFLCDLTHTGRGYSSEFIPLAIGCIKSYLKAFSRFSEQVEVKLFKNPQKAIDAYLEERPGVVGFSNFSWNFHLGSSIAREIKNTEPETLIVFGGPNYPLEDPVCETWFKKAGAADLYVIGDGEETFTKVFDFWYEYRDIEGLKRRGFDGCHALVDEKFFKANGLVPRVKQLDLAPSPYLEGYFDEWLREEMFIPMMETTRGCPFTCTFCDKGTHIWSKINRKSVRRFEEELEYVAQRYSGKLLTMADDNFGMYEQDVETAHAIARVKEKYDYPYFVNSATGKNRQENILKVAEILKGSLQFTASVQSMDEQVLKNVKRKNIRYEVLLNAAKEAEHRGATPRSEVIIGLPGDTLQKYRETIYKLLDAQIQIIQVFTLMFLEGTELATRAQRELWQMRSKYRVNYDCFGVYSFSGKDILSAELEEVCVASKSMSLDDYVECRMLIFTVGLFYNDAFLAEIFHFLENFNIKPSKFVDRLHQNRESFSPPLAELYRQFEAATRAELWDSEEQLRDHLVSSRGAMEKYVDGNEGRNLLLTYRGLGLATLMSEVVEAAFRVAKDLIKEIGNDLYQEYASYLSELKKFCIYRKVNVFDCKQRYRDAFHYDFRALFEGNFRGLPNRLSAPIEIDFFSSRQQIRRLTAHGTDVFGLRKVLSRWDLGKLQRSLRFASKTNGERLAQRS